MKLVEISINEIQLYIARNVELHPVLYSSFLKQLNDLAHKNCVSLLPSTIFEYAERRHKKVG